MKKFFYLYATVLLLVFTSCQKRFENLQNNPNIATSVPPDLILNRLINGVASGLGGIEPWGAVAKYNQFFCRNFEYYGDNRYNWNNGPFNVYSDILKNVVQMETEAKRVSGTDKTFYHAIAKFMKAYYYYNLTSLMGDVPASEAAKALDGVLQPKYDTQKDVFLQVLKLLEEANTDFAALKAGNLAIKGDIFYNGDFDKWRKMVNSYKLRVLIALSKKTSDPDLRVMQRFQEVLGNPASFPVFESKADNFEYVYITPTNNYPTNPVQFASDAIRLNMAQTYVKNGVDLKDPRILVTCEPAWKLINDNGWAPTDFRAFVAAGTGEALNIMENEAFNYSICHINRYRYYRAFTSENFIIAGYTEMCFNIAEAINRGWATGNAEDWYKKGIKNSIDFYGVVEGTNTGKYLGIGKELGEWTNADYTFHFSDYYSQAKVVYEAGVAGLNKILLQKYLSFFQNSGWEAYYNYRRTGIPAFSTGVGIGNNGNIPKRWTYPSTEQQRNPTNWKAAVDRQFAGADDINGVMWLIK